MSRILEIFRGRRRRAMLAAVATAVLLALVWAGDRSAQAMGSEQLQMKGHYLLSRLFNGADRPLPEDILAVNIGYDRQLVPVTDPYGFPAGEIDVTDRGHLREYLEAIRGAGYRSVVVDVFFDAALPAEGDSALFATLNALERVVVPRHHDADVHPAIEPDLTAWGDYGVNFNESSFVKYTFICGGEESLALRVYRQNGGSAFSGSAFYEQPAIFLPLPVTVREPFTADGEKTWYNLGADLLEVYTPDELAAMASGKTVVIGDFTTADMHDTYKDRVSGPVILINAIGALERGEQRISILSALLMAVTFFLICFCMLTGETLWGMLEVRPGPITAFFLNLLGFSVALTVLWVALYGLFGEIHDAFLPGLFCSAMALFSTILNQKYPLCPYVTLKRCCSYSLRRLAALAPARTSESSPSTPPQSTSEANS